MKDSFVIKPSDANVSEVEQWFGFQAGDTIRIESDEIHHLVHNAQTDTPLFKTLASTPRKGIFSFPFSAYKSLMSAVPIHSEDFTLEARRRI